eukprot:1182351-Prorocentrum_minimum.AAC.3
MGASEPPWFNRLAHGRNPHPKGVIHERARGYFLSLLSSISLISTLDSGVRCMSYTPEADTGGDSALREGGLEDGA